VFAATGLTLVEWPEKAAAVMPTPDLLIALEPATDTARAVQVHAFTPHGQTLCQHLFAA
jgi:tRNA threonylcarbamoyladenosine biosynthesis protein TsaE